MTTIARLAKRNDSKEFSFTSSGTSVMESFEASKETITKKFDALTSKKQEREASITTVKAQIHRWDGLIYSAGYGRERLSENANKAIDKLIAQAERYSLSTQKELAMHEQVLNRIQTQLSAIEEMIVRLKNAEYELQLHESFKNLKMNELSEGSTEDISFSLEELERDIKRLEYTSEALLELGA